MNCIPLFALALLSSVSMTETSRAQLQEETAGARLLLHSAFDEFVRSTQKRFASEDHAMVVGRKFSVDWSLTPALFLSEIIGGAPPSQWCRVLDDGYGSSAALHPRGPCDREQRLDEMPPEVTAGCALIRSHARGFECEFVAERAHAAGAEVPPAIGWRCVHDGESMRMRTMWYEPQISLRGVDFPLPADRTLLEWDGHMMRVRVLGESIDSQEGWPLAAPLFDHVGDAYDLFDTLRAWHWANRSDGGVAATDEPNLVGRSCSWSRTGDHSWTLSISLRPAIAIRRAGFILRAEGAANAELASARPDARVTIVPANTILSIVFTKDRRSREEVRGLDTDGVFLPSRISLTRDGAEIAWATFGAITIGAPIDATHPDPLMPTSAWSDAILRIRLAQESPVAPPSFPSTLLTARWPKAIVRARLTANAWIAAMKGDLVGLVETLTAAQVVRQRDGLAHHELAALQTLAESLTCAKAGDAVINALVVRHSIAATELATQALAPHCLAATGTGRFWAALDIARAALARTESNTVEAKQWQRVESQLMQWRDEPAAHIAFGCDAAVVLLGERLRPDRIAGAASLPVETHLLSTVDGHAAGAAYRIIAHTLDPTWITRGHQSLQPLVGPNEIE